MTTVYTVRGPNGEKYKVTGPDDATDDELIDQVQKYLAPKTGWSGSLQKGLEGLTSAGRTAAGAVFGDPNEAARAALEREKTAALRYPEQVSMEKVKEAYQRGLLPAAGEVLRQIPHAIAEQVPQLGTTIASGMAGARLGAMAGPVGGIVGGIAGMATPSLVQQLGGNVQRQAKEQTEAGQPIDINMTRAVGAAVPQAGLDVLETRLLLGSKLFTSLTGKALGEVTKEQAEKLAKDGLMKTIGKGAVRGVVSEVPTEVTQQMLERWQAGLDLTSPEALAEYGDTAYQTALLGPLGIPGQFAQRSQARDMVAPPPSEIPATQPPVVTTGEGEYVTPEAVVEKTTSLKTSGKKAEDVTLDEAINDIAAYQQKLATGDYRGDKHKANIENKIKQLEARRAELEAAGQPAEEAEPEEEAEGEDNAEAQPGVIDAAAIDSLGIKGQGSRRVKKALIGLDLNTPDGKATFNTLFQSPGLRFNEEAVTALFGGPITPVEVAAPAAPVLRKPILQGDQGGASAVGQADRAGTGVSVQGEAAAPGVAEAKPPRVGESGGPTAGPAGGTPGGDVALAEAQAKADAEVQARADAEAKAKADAEAQARADAEAAVERQKKVLEEAATKDREIKAQRRKEIAGKAQAALAQEGEAPKKKDKTVMNPALIRREGLELLTKEDMSPGDYTRGVEYLVDSKADDLLKLLGIPKKDIDTARQRMNAANIKALTEESFSEIATPITRDRYKALLDFLIEEPNPKAKANNLRRLRKGQVSEKDIKESEARVAKANVARKLAASKKDKTKKNLDQLQRGDRRDISRLQERYFDLQEDIAFTQDQVSELKVRGEPYATEEQHAYSQMVALEEVKAAAKERGIEFPESRSGIRYSRIMEGERRPTKGSLARDVANELEKVLRDGSALERLVTVVQSPSQLPEEVRQAKDFSDKVRGVAHRGRVYLVADNIESKRELGVFLHEAGAHLGFDRVMSKEDRQFLADQVRGWATEQGMRGDVAREALAKGGTNNDEVIAYTVEGLVNRGVKPTGLRPESTWLRRVLNAFKAAMEKIGLRKAAMEKIGLRKAITEQDLVDAAFGAAHITLKTPIQEGSNRTRFGSEPTKFKKWFGDSKVVDAEGRPLVVYHGTNADISAFWAKAVIDHSPQNWFSDDPAGAGFFAETRSGNQAIYPVFLSIANPFRVHVSKGSGKHPLRALTNALGVGTNSKTGMPRGYALKQALVARGYDGVMFTFEGSTQTHWVPVKATQIKSAIGNNGNYDATNPDIRFSTGSAALDLGVRLRGDSLTRSGDQPLYKQVWDALGSAEKRKKLYMKFRNSVEDQSASVKDKLLEKGFARPVMGLAFASRSMDMAAHSMLTGAIKLRRKDNMFVIPPGKHDSIRTVYEQVQKIADKLPSGSPKERMTTAKRVFDLGGIHLRNESLSPEDRAKFKFPPEDIAAGKDAMAMYGEEIRRGMDAWTNYKNGLLDAAQVAGRLSAEEVHELKKAVDYVPWYRVLEDAKFGFETKSSAKKFFSGLQDTGKIHELMGGSIEDRPIGNLLENMERLSFWLVNASMKNHAANQVVDALLTVDVERMGSPDATHTEKGTPVDKKRVIFTYRNGKKTYYQMGDELDTDAFTSTIQFTGPIMKLAAKGTNFLRKGVTYMPNFVVSQLFQDSFRVTTFSGAKNPFAVGLDTYSQFLKEMKGDKLSEVLASLGLVGRADYIFGDEASRVGAELDRTHTGFKKLASSGFRMLDRMTRASDMAQRRAVFQKTLEETGDEALAAYKAIEIINFQTHGKAQAIQALRHLVPFTNAYIQGMSVTLRSMFGSGVTLQERRAAMLKFYATGIKIAALSAMYAALVGDDDDYEQMPDHEKISSFMIPGTREMIKQFTGTDPGGNIRIPVPMDFVGLAFKALPEAGVNTFLKEAAGSEVDYAKVRRGLSNAAINAAFPPGFVPQIVKPSLEVWANKSFFTDRPIVGWGLRNREREQQFTASTSEFAKILAGVIPLAPVQIDHLARGYLGMGGGLAMDLASSLLDGTTPGERPSKFLNETPVIKSFLTSNSASGLKEDYYELREKATMVADTVRTLATRDPEKLLEYIEKDGKREQLMVAQSGVLRQIDSALGDIRKARDIIDNDKNMSADDKRDKLDQLERLEVEVLSRMQLTALRKLAKL